MGKLRQGGFERVLGLLEGEPNSDYWDLSIATEDMFAAMNSGFLEPLDSAPNQGAPISSLLASFDAIYTLNQDLLMERHYSSPFQGWYRPGLVEVDPKWTAGTTDKWWTGAGPEGQQLTFQRQPYVKLHGSSDYKRELSSAGPLVTMVVQGVRKSSSIDEVPLLAWYRSLFEQHLRGQDVRLMIIGYGFGDEHINSMLLNAAQDGQLKFFIVDPEGMDALSDNSGVSLAPYVRGASRRPLRETYSPSGTVEVSKFSRFLRS